MKLTKFLGEIAVILTLIGSLIRWLKENKKNCYREAGLIDEEEDDFPQVE